MSVSIAVEVLSLNAPKRMCEQKRSHMMQGEKWVQLGFRAF